MEKFRFNLINLSLALIFMSLSANATTCTEATSLVDQKIALVRSEIKAIKKDAKKPQVPNLKLNRIKHINSLVQRCYQIIDKSQVGLGKVKYSEVDWLEDNPEADIASLTDPGSNGSSTSIEDLKILITDLENVKANLEANDGLDILCDFEIGSNPWIEEINFTSDSDTNNYDAVILKFQRFVSKNVTIFEKLPTSAGLIRDEFAPEIPDKAELRLVAKRERKYRRVIYRLLIKIYRMTEKIS